MTYVVETRESGREGARASLGIDGEVVGGGTNTIRVRNATE